MKVALAVLTLALFAPNASAMTELQTESAISYGDQEISYCFNPFQEGAKHPDRWTKKQAEACVGAMVMACIPPHPVWSPMKASIGCFAAAHVARPHKKRK